MNPADSFTSKNLDNIKNYLNTSVSTWNAVATSLSKVLAKHDPDFQ